ncbi:hypothetical protein ACHHYP_20281 [Achlya hypogyna]|uniref:CBM1 domain-containing protein n=1 Tax=Achlya hypogyna TaxID=1202772 RepID=A0A1V9YT57_ACHHY|nr:hypothetical protein ACHHYP_20281 [Achlya hypogyna]
MPTRKPTHKPHASGVNKRWQQCGGKNFTGSTQCMDNDKCHKYDAWYSQCIPVNPHSS